ncbi:MAG TPA: alpha/beta hydrolase [Pyrinomonadaceae bacterium]|nr:alpha/beta hydrolase [Pyrinomonadaceae bacterium]
MPPRRRFGKRLIKSFLPIALVIVLAVVGALSFIVYCVSRPTKRPYVVTPESFSRISGRALKVTDETWTNLDGRHARGWLLKGAEGAPAVVLLHRYGGDRSWLFNLGVKINEATNFTILWPDLRGHGEDPLIKWTSVGAKEGDDLVAAFRYLRGLKSENQKTLVGESLGVYGVELGAYTALKAVRSEAQIKVLVLDSVASSPNELLSSAVSTCVGMDNSFIQSFSRLAMKLYLLGAYDDTNACEFAHSIRDGRVLLLTGADAGNLRNATASLQSCFPVPANVDTRTDLPLSGYSLPSATGEQGEAYDRIVIEYFDRNLR